MEKPIRITIDINGTTSEVTTVTENTEKAVKPIDFCQDEVKTVDFDNMSNDKIMTMLGDLLKEQKSNNDEIKFLKTKLEQLAPIEKSLKHLYNTSYDKFYAEQKEFKTIVSENKCKLSDDKFHSMLEKMDKRHHEMYQRHDRAYSKYMHDLDNLKVINDVAQRENKELNNKIKCLEKKITQMNEKLEIYLSSLENKE